MQIIFNRADLIDSGWEVKKEDNDLTTFGRDFDHGEQGIHTALMTMRDFGDTLSLRIDDAQWTSHSGERLRDVLSTTGLSYHSVH